MEIANIISNYLFPLILLILSIWLILVQIEGEGKQEPVKFLGIELPPLRVSAKSRNFFRIVGMSLMIATIGWIGLLWDNGMSDSPFSISSNSKEVRIESFPVKVFNYDGLQDPQVNQGWAELSIGHSEGSTSYLFDFDLPTESDLFGYAGLDFRFDQTQDLSSFKTIKVVINYFDESTFCELFIKDFSYKGNYILLGNQSPTGGSLQVNGTEYTYVIPLSAFPDPNFKAIYEVGLSVDTDIVRGKHRITVSQITFTK